MRTDLLGALQRHLETLEATKPTKREREFDIGTIYTRGNRSCKTAACAMGEAAFVPEIRKAGLRLQRYSGCTMTIHFQKEHGYSAATKLFEISSWQTHELFDPSCYNSVNVQPGKVAERIARLIERAA